MNNTDSEYFRLLNLVLEKGRVKKNRTGIDTIGVFGAQARFNLQEGFPLLTTKKVFFKGIAHELLWFISGSTNIKYLVDNNVHIWDEWAYKRYLSWAKHCQERYGGIVSREPWTQEQYIEQVKLGNADPKLSDLGEGTYGGMWRAFPVTHYYNQEQLVKYSVTGDTISSSDGERYVQFVDQLQKLVSELKTNPDSRRHIVSAWHPYWVDHCALPPCHVLFQFHTEELTLGERFTEYHSRPYPLLPKYIGESETSQNRCLDEIGVPKRRLNCQLYQRSCDLYLGVPFNIASYALLTHMVAQVCGMVAGEFIHTYGDLHLYENSIEAAKLQLSRKPFENLPKLKLNPSVDNLFNFRYEDITLEGYQSHEAIKVAVAV